jgi:hypothetical protein
MTQRSVFAALLFSFLTGLSPLAASTVVQHGIDVFTTPADGRTYYDFAHNPIPAGFFCEDSQVFTDRVALKGLPLATGVPGQLRGGDTVVERLDDVGFNAKRTAVTRIQVRALSLVSVSPIKTACGDFHVYVSLGGPQRVTLMSIYRTQEGGGTFVAPLAIDARMTFIPVKPMRTKGSRKLELLGSVNFPPKSLPWSFTTNAMTKSIGSIAVDTDGDLTPDTLLSGTSNFSPGWLPESLTLNKGTIGGCCQTCHDNNGEQHCFYPSGCFPMPCDD